MFTVNDTAARGTTLFDFPAPSGSVVGAAFDDALETNPVPMFMLSRELTNARESGPRLPREQALEEAKRAGVGVTVPADGITQQALGILIERRRDDAARQVLYARREGVAATAGMFAAGLAGAMMDPVNAAAGFIPILGGTRYAGMLAEASTVGARAGVRLGIGAVEGAVGAAAVEVPTMALRRDLQDDYSLYDSLANIAFGTVASAGLRGVSGAARDAWVGIARARELDALRAVDPEVWQSMRLAAESTQERAFWQDLEVGFQRGVGIPEGMRAAFERDRFEIESRGAADEFGAAMGEERDFRASAHARIAAAADEAIDRRFRREHEKLLAAGMEPDEALRQSFARTFPETERALASAAEIGERRLSEFAAADARSRIAEGRGLILVPRTAGDVQAAISGATHAQALRTAVAQAVEGRVIDVEPVVRRDPAFGQQRASIEVVRERSRANAAPDAKVGADRGASERASEAMEKPEVAAAPKAKASKDKEAEKSPELTEAEALRDDARTQLDETLTSGGALEERLANTDLRAELEGMKSETGWFQVGGSLVRTHGLEGEVIGRTDWIANAAWWPGRPKGLTEAKVKAAVDKALAGEPLKAAERRTIEYMLDVGEERMRAAGWEPTPAELLGAGLTKADAFDVSLAARATEIDEARVEALAIKFETDDVGFMRAMKELLDEYDTNAKAGEGGQGGERPQGGRAETAAQSPEVAKAETYEAAWRALGDCANGGGL